MRFMIKGLALLALMAMCGTAMADLTSHGTTDVYVVVNPNIGIVPLDLSVDMGNVQTGVFYGLIPWRVDANTQNVKFWGAASYLYKGNDPSNPAVPPINLNQTYGIHFDIAHGGPIGGEDNILAYINAVVIDGFPGWETEVVEYESSDPGHMSQDCSMQVSWIQTDPEKPMGEYSGKVRLSGMVVI